MASIAMLDQERSFSPPTQGGILYKHTSECRAKSQRRQDGDSQRSLAVSAILVGENLQEQRRIQVMATSCNSNQGTRADETVHSCGLCSYTATDETDTLGTDEKVSTAENVAKTSNEQHEDTLYGRENETNERNVGIGPDISIDDAEDVDLLLSVCEWRDETRQGRYAQALNTQ
jgi:ribosomal protein L37AE/L43A